MGAMAGPKLTSFSAHGGMSPGLNGPVDRPRRANGPFRQARTARRTPVRSMYQGGDR
jgi:hypothetical protein